jgi:hypothetical protein
MVTVMVVVGECWEVMTDGRWIEAKEVLYPISVL